MILTTTHSIEGRKIRAYLGLVSGEAILGANIFKDLFAGIRDIVGGRSAAYEKELIRAKEIAVQEMQERAAVLGLRADRRPDLGDLERHEDQPSPICSPAVLARLVSL